MMTGPIGCLATSVRNYHYSLHNNLGERSSQPVRGGSLKSRTVPYVSNILNIFVQMEKHGVSQPPQFREITQFWVGGLQN
jgi:hypothetical protein